MDFLDKMGSTAINSTLQCLSAELAETARRLDVLSRTSGKAKFIVRELTEIKAHGRALSALARDEHDARRLRERFIPTELFGEPAWDMMLDLFAHSIIDEDIPISSAQIGAHCPPTTALRYVGLLEEEGMATRTKSETDGRVNYLRLTEAALVSVGSYLMARSGLSDDTIN